jgi:hypothetical protein
VGLLPARSLSNNIWVADGKQTWSNAMPLHWIVFADDKQTLNLTVTARNLTTGATFVIVDSALEQVPADEAHTISPTSTQSVYSLVKPLPALPASGCLEISAIVQQSGASGALYQGKAIIFAQDRAS